MKKIIFAIILLKLVSFNLYANDAWVIKNFPDSVNIVDIAVNSINEIFVATTYQPNPDVWPSGLFYYSSDDGNSWTQLLEVGKFSEIMDILIDADDNIYLGTWFGSLYKSIDHGFSWERKDNGLSNFAPVYLSINSIGTIYAGQYVMGDLDYSVNGGDLWIQTNYSSSGIRGLGICHNDNIFVDGGKYSRDNGNTWITIDSGLSEIALINTVCYGFNNDNEAFLGSCDGLYSFSSVDSVWLKVLSTNNYITDFIISSENEIYVGTRQATFFSGNNGHDWQNIDDQFSNEPPHTFCFDAEGYLWAVSDRTIYKSQSVITAIEGQSVQSGEIKIFPNPFSEYIHIEFENFENECIKISIHNLEGKLLRSQSIGNTNAANISLNDLKSGVYFITLVNGNSIIKTQRVIKQ